MDCDKKLNSILRRHYGFIMTALGENIIIPYWASSLCNSTQYGIYFLTTSRHYKAVMSSQNRI